MSKVNLNSVIFFRGGADRRPTVNELHLEGIDSYFPEISFPKGGMTFLYGHRNPAVPHLLKLAAAKELDAVSIDVLVEIGKWLRQKIDFSDDPESGLANTRFLSVVRAKKPIIDTLEDYWVRSLGDAEASNEPWPRGPTRHPYLLDGLMKLPEFKHLAVVAYSVSTKAIEEFQVATVFDMEAIELINGGWRLQDVEFVI